jgi:hypothetical protein
MLEHSFGEPTMKQIAIVAIALVVILPWGCRKSAQEVERPEKILSLRQVSYDHTAYVKLAELWKKYYDVYPSEDAYANWMYAAHYADDPNCPTLLAQGVEKYPANPVLLDLAGMSKLNRQEIVEGTQLMEKSAALDPYYMDPWFGLVVAYLAQGDREKENGALRKLLAGGAIEDAIMDLCYNMIASTDTNAILVTNGDNDTFPCWILTRIVQFRPDVNIVNRPLLNTTWYQTEILKDGVMPFVTHSELDSLQVEVSRDGEKLKNGEIAPEKFVLLADRLVIRIVESARRAGRPVYFACTLEQNEMVKTLMSQGRRLGLVTLVTPPTKGYTEQVQGVFQTWVRDFRTGGLDSWQLHSAKENRSSRQLVGNYIAALRRLSDQIQTADPAVRLSLFRWYRDHLLDYVQKDLLMEVNSMWCGKNPPKEIDEWCKHQGLAK